MLTVPEIRLHGETALGGSALFGARHSRYVKGRLAVEADLAVAPTHALETGQLWVTSGRSGEARDRKSRVWGPGNLTAWHYGGAGDADSDLVLRFGAGLKILFGRLGARVDVVDHLVTRHFLSGEAEHDIHATAGFLVRF